MTIRLTIRHENVSNGSWKTFSIHHGLWIIFLVKISPEGRRRKWARTIKSLKKPNDCAVFGFHAFELLIANRWRKLGARAKEQITVMFIHANFICLVSCEYDLNFAVNTSMLVSHCVRWCYTTIDSRSERLISHPCKLNHPTDISVKAACENFSFNSTIHWKVNFEHRFIHRTSGKRKELLATRTPASETKVKSNSILELVNLNVTIRFSPRQRKLAPRPGARIKVKAHHPSQRCLLTGFGSELKEISSLEQKALKQSTADLLMSANWQNKTRWIEGGWGIWFSWRLI